MKILKIELQNINSLKSEDPIVIDFESAAFRDVGLYAITGSTGAGKTTVLDAITIALYNRVPRLSNVRSKASLEDVVSYGADGAMARVTFENGGVRYEASWSMRLRTKNGVRLTNPKEEVRLKDLSKELILAEKKTELKTEVERVCRLDYNQFLRSVMLAQGDFAAFLAADNKDKGTLLEQITGEEVYKKIGEVVSARVFDEKKTLEGIRSRINTEDLLSADEVTVFKEEAAELGEKLAANALELQKVVKMLEWYGKQQVLAQAKQRIDSSESELNQLVLNHKASLLALEGHKNAEGFKTVVDELLRCEKEKRSKFEYSVQLNSELEVLNLSYQSCALAFEKENVTYLKLEESTKEWSSKLEVISVLDSQLKQVVDTKALLDIDCVDHNKSVASISEALMMSQNLHAANLIVQEEIQTYLTAHAQVEVYEKELNSWSVDLSSRKTIYASLSKTKTELEQLAILQQTSGREWTKIRQEYEAELDKVNRIKLKLKSVDEQLLEKDLDKLLKNKQEKEAERQTWIDFIRLAEEHRLLKEDQSKVLLTKDSLESEQLQLGKDLSAVKERLQIVQLSVADGERILHLEKEVVRFSEERKRLVPNEPCFLCGSKVHPYVEHYVEVEFSKTEQVVLDRKKDLDELSKSEKDLDITLSNSLVKQSNLLAQLSEIQKRMNAIQERANALGKLCDLQDMARAQHEKSLLDDLLEDGAKEWRFVQQLLADKELLNKELAALNERIRSSSNLLFKWEEKIANQEKERAEKLTNVSLLTHEANVLDDQLSSRLGVFEFVLPSCENTTVFLKQLENEIDTFVTKSKELGSVKLKLTQLAGELAAYNLALKEKQTLLLKISKQQNELTAELTRLQTERAALLPLHISTADKRLELQNAMDEGTKVLKRAEEELKSIHSSKITKAKELQLLADELVKLDQHLSDETTKLNALLKDSSFGSRQEVEAALLSLETKNAYERVQRDIHTRQVELATQTNSWQHEMVAQALLKDFELSYEQAVLLHTSIETQKMEFLSRVGEIKEKFKLDAQIKERNSKVVDDIRQQEVVLKKWDDLLKLLGGSKHAFNTYVQRLTLQRLIHLANVHLYQLNRRYSLKMEETYKSGEELNFMLVDHYQTDQMRYVDTSSGGEKFIISLALALGLSDLASNNVNIDSLFIDEGFGTLDANTLEIVISTLETLQAQGKMIGVISHVENLKERISTQIQVTKKSNGVSVLTVV